MVEPLLDHNAAPNTLMRSKNEHTADPRRLALMRSPGMLCPFPIRGCSEAHAALFVVGVAAYPLILLGYRSPRGRSSVEGGRACAPAARRRTQSCQATSTTVTQRAGT